MIPARLLGLFSMATMTALLAVSSADAASVNAGRRLAMRNCAVCHAIGIEGESPNPRSPTLRDLYRRYPLGRVEEALREGMLRGHRAMPPMRLSDRQIEDLIAYLRSIQLPNREPPRI